MPRRVCEGQTRPPARAPRPAAPPLQVRFARSHQYVQAGSGPEDNRQLFFARAPATALEPDIMALFSRFGAVEEINVFRERRSNQSKGCGFVTMASRAEAVAAMDALDERHLMVRVEKRGRVWTLGANH